MTRIECKPLSIEIKAAETEGRVRKVEALEGVGSEILLNGWMDG